MWVFERKDGKALPPYPQAAKVICCEEWLYGYRTRIEGEGRAEVETNVMSVIDANGLKVIEKLRAKEGTVLLNAKDKKHLSIFLSSLRVRTPEILKTTSTASEEVLRREVRKFDNSLDNENLRKALNGNSVEQWLEKENPEILLDAGIRHFKSLMLGQANLHGPINRMILSVITSPVPLLTSDRPLIMLGDKQSPRFGFAMAISPTKLIFLAREKNLAKHALKSDPLLVGAKMNESTVRYSKQKVFANSRNHCDIEFINQFHGKDFDLLPMQDVNEFVQKMIEIDIS